MKIAALAPASTTSALLRLTLIKSLLLAAIKPRHATNEQNHHLQMTDTARNVLKPRRPVELIVNVVLV